MSLAGATSSSLPLDAPESPTCRYPHPLSCKNESYPVSLPLACPPQTVAIASSPISLHSLACHALSQTFPEVCQHPPKAFFQELWRLIRLNRDLGLPPSIVLYKRLTVAIGRVRGLYDLRLVLPAYLSEGLPLCRSILDAIINACGKSSSFEYAWVLSSFLTQTGDY